LGALKGSISYCRFFVRGKLPSSRLHQTFLERIRLRAFEPLKVEDEVEERAGWCSIVQPFDLELSHEKVFYNSYLNLGLRIDRWRIPRPLFVAQFEEAQAAYLAKKGREKLGKKEKEDLKVMVTRRLRKLVIPSMKSTDVSWNMDAGVVRLYSHSKKAQAYLDGLFKQTFELELIPESPFSAAVHLGVSEQQAEHLSELEPESFHPGAE
jgi:hypothetical protein